MNRSVKIRLVAGLIFLLILIAGLVFAFILTRRSQDIRQKAATQTGTARFVLTPATSTFTPGSQANIKLSAENMGTATLVGFQAVFNASGAVPTDFTFTPLNPDTSKLQVLKSTATDVNQSKQIQYALGVKLKSDMNSFETYTPGNTSKIIGQITFTTPTTGSLVINFDDARSYIIQSGTNQDLLAPVTDYTYAFANNNIPIQVAFQGASAATPAKTGSAILKMGTTTKYTLGALTFTPGSDIKFTSNLTAIQPGTYDVYIKSQGYLQKKFAAQALTTTALKDFSATPLKAGDFNNDNVFNISDVGLILSTYTALSVPVTTSNKLYDINSDNTINIQDIAIVLSNFTQLSTIGD